MICARRNCGTVFCDDDDYPPGSERRRRYCSGRCRELAKSRRRRGRQRFLAASVPGACPRPYKLRFATQAAAETATAEVAAARGVTLYVYPCECGWWHMTKNPPSLLAA